MPDKNFVQPYVFDFDETFLLPKLEKKPGQLHFITGLKFDKFGAKSTNLQRKFGFGLPEGHWPSEKMANTMVSMLHETFKHTKKNNIGSGRLVLHTDNCARQNKNRFLLWYLYSRVLVGFEHEIYIHFFIDGHTKYVCDWAFRHVKQRLLKAEVRFPKEIMNVIEQSSTKSTCVPPIFVRWKNWKTLMEQYFKMPQGCKVSKYHVFGFHSTSAGSIEAQELSMSKTAKTFVLRKGPVAVDTIRENAAADELNPRFDLRTTSLTAVKSQKHEKCEKYLKGNVLDRYYRDNARLRGEYFEGRSFRLNPFA